MKIIICDDKQSFCDLLKNKIKQISKELDFELEIYCYNNANEILGNLEILTDTLFLLDIEMPEISGFDFARKLHEISNKVNIIFISSKDELVFQSMNYNPIYFIRKNHLDDELKEQLIKVLYKSNKDKINAKLINQNGKEINLHIGDIMYAESKRNYLFLYKFSNTPSNLNEPISIRKTISEAITEWKCYGFIRIHKGFLVNKNYIIKSMASSVIMANGEKIDIGRSYIDIVRKNLMEE